MPNSNCFIFKVLSPQGYLIEEVVEFLRLPSQTGEVGIFVNHSPSVFTLAPGEVVIQKEDGSEESLFLSSGFAHVTPTEVVISTQNVEYSNSLDLERAQSAKERALKHLHPESDSSDKSRALNALKRADGRLRVIESSKTN